MPRLLRILSLDSCVEDVRRLRSCLQSHPSCRVSVQQVRQTQDVIARLAEVEADVLFIDEDLPRVTGVEAISALRSRGEARPIVATTVTDCGYLAADLMRAGADGYLAKRDLEPEPVIRVLDRAMHNARARQANDRLRRSAVRNMLAMRGHALIGL